MQPSFFAILFSPPRYEGQEDSVKACAFSLDLYTVYDLFHGSVQLNDKV